MTKRERGAGVAASVEVEEVTPTEASARVLLAQHEGRKAQTVDEDQGIITTHNRPGTMIMYKPLERGGYVPKTVSVSALRLLMRQGWQEHCPDCNGDHINAEGVASTDPNLCAASDPVAVRVCQVCQKRIYDNITFAEQAEGDDVNVIKEEAYENSTGASRTKASLDIHLWARHPRQAQMMGVPPLPTAMRDMVSVEAKGV